MGIVSARGRHGQIEDSSLYSWSIFHTDRCGAISTFFPPAFAADVVTTPYPRPLTEYALVSLFSSLKRVS